MAEPGFRLVTLTTDDVYERRILLFYEPSEAQAEFDEATEQAGAQSVTLSFMDTFGKETDLVRWFHETGATVLVADWPWPDDDEDEEDDDTAEDDDYAYEHGEAQWRANRQADYDALWR